MFRLNAPKIPDSGHRCAAPARLHLTCEPRQERWHLADPSPPGAWSLSHGSARCLRRDGGGRNTRGRTTFSRLKTPG
ncbi:hypothetical protein DPEC_G00344880 [Dallia pectoralis]|uniref:Uncharacterized protein n=1 Tax=Dallia pectoralis TaxID=75939 RepID=A0ACC2F3D7_DALPE|nr:hypothetical protein DPEC_G00344880 [Dallia pectoralis]